MGIYSPLFITAEDFTIREMNHNIDNTGKQEASKMSGILKNQVIMNMFTTYSPGYHNVYAFYC